MPRNSDPHFQIYGADLSIRTQWDDQLTALEYAKLMGSQGAVQLLENAG